MIPNKYLSNYKGDTKDFRKLEKSAKQYRETLLNIIESKLKELEFKISDFDKGNYDLRRAFNDGGTYHLTLLKELIKDV